ncbi:DUF4328 domain-containing protein [Luteolibacter arcticus]|uniref:DUF4328 domain-containing protein n=1 Tax=Luteolibacter arcticus TaxID=1581411 RepID=A0ABT3GPF0_9BACT|nr:DUF4328 domain-containing protein [Luteolibacter arcticus]MCW1925399.1 DUF4328 domain-containing protein [Luteolibacter arcticus]
MTSGPESNPYQPPASDPTPPETPASTSAEQRPDLRIKDPRNWGWATISFIWLNCLTITLRQVRVEHPAWLVFLALAVALTLLCAIVSYMLWLFRVAVNAQIISPNSGPSPGWAIGCYFIPFVNWLLPAMVMKEIADASFRGKPHKGTGYLVAVWWTSFILLNLCLSFRPESIFVLILSWIAGVAVSWLILRISLRQVDLRESGLPKGPRPVLLPTSGPRPVAATRLPQPVRSDAPAGRPGPPSRPGGNEETRGVSGAEDW